MGGLISTAHFDRACFAAAAEVQHVQKDLF